MNKRVGLAVSIRVCDTSFSGCLGNVVCGHIMKSFLSENSS